MFFFLPILNNLRIEILAKTDTIATSRLILFVFRLFSLSG